MLVCCCCACGFFCYCNPALNAPHTMRHAHLPLPTSADCCGQDLLDKAPVELDSSGCDSSDCLLCQGQRQFCNQAITNTSCMWLGRRRSSCSAPANSQLSSATGSQHGAPAQQHRQPRQQLVEQPLQLSDLIDEQQGQRKRLRLSPSRPFEGSTGDLSTAVAVDSSPGSSQQQEQAPQQAAGMQHEDQHQLDGLDLPSPLCSPVLQHSSSAQWQWQPQFASLAGPAPARFTEVARLQSAADAAAGHCAGRCDRISGLEFSYCGQLVAAAGVSKQVRQRRSCRQQWGSVAHALHGACKCSVGFLRILGSDLLVVVVDQREETTT